MKGDSDDHGFLQRWSRLKEQARTEAEEPAPSPAPSAVAQTQAPVVPPVESLTMDSDYRDFFHPKIEEGLRRAALKKLFADPHFNVMDGLDVYIDDYSKSDPLPEALLGQLEQAKKILGWSREDAEQRARAEAGQRHANRQDAEEQVQNKPGSVLTDNPAGQPQTPLASIPEPAAQHPRRREPDEERGQE